MRHLSFILPTVSARIMTSLCTFGVVVLLTTISISASFKILKSYDTDEQINVKDHPKGFGTAKHAIIIGECCECC